MKKSPSEYDKLSSSMVTFNEYDDDYDDGEWNVSNLQLTLDNFCRKLTSNDINQALYTLKISEKSSKKRTIYSGDDTATMRLESETIECSCCCLLRSSRSLLPLARRGRPHYSTHSHRLLCSNCTEIKRKQQIDILQKLNSNTILQPLNNLDISSEENQMMTENIPREMEFSLINQQEKQALNNCQYPSAEVLVWKINTSNDHNQLNAIDISYDTGSLTSEEKKILLGETIKKLQILLENPSTLITDNREFTYRALQTTMNILSSSLNSI